MKKFSIIIIFVMVLCSFNTLGALTDNLMDVWKFENNAIDSIGTRNLTATGGITYNDTAKDGAGAYCTSGKYFDGSGSAEISGTYSGFTANMWVYPENVVSNHYLFQFGIAANGRMELSGYGDSTNTLLANTDGTDGTLTLPYTTTYYKNNVWQMLTYVYNGSHVVMFHNSSQRGSAVASGNLVMSASTTTEICNNYEFLYNFKGTMDEFYIWNRSLSQAEITSLYNSGTGYFYPFASAVNPLQVNTIVLKNLSGNVLTTTLSSYDLFKISTNVTYNNVFNSSINCSYNSSNIWEQYPYFSNNVSFFNNYTAIFNTYLATGVLNDSYSFKICREGNTDVRNVDIFVNNSFQKNVPYTQIPTCTNGFHEETFYSNVTPTISHNLTVKCVGNCNPANTFRIISDSRNVTSKLNRQYSVHAERSVANSSSSLFEDSDYGTHFFSNTDTNYITSNCSGFGYANNLTSSYSVTSVNVTGSILEVVIDNTSYDFNNSMVLESGINYTFVGDCVGGISLLSSQINITYNNGTLVSSANNEFISVNKSQITENGIYNLTLYCNALNSTYITRNYFNVTDTVTPYIYPQTPLTDGTTEVNRYNYQLIDVLFQDVNLYRVNASCINSFGIPVLNTGYVYVNGSSSYELLTYTSNNTILGAVTCTYCADDSHTKHKIPELVYYQENNTLIFKGENNNKLRITYEDNDKNFIVEKGVDRYSFTPVTKYKHMSKLNYRISCDGTLNYIESSGYFAHFVCDNKWVDFEIEGLSKNNYVVTHVIGNEYKITISIPDSLDNYKTKSVGIINTHCRDVYYTVVEPSTATGTTVSFTELIIALTILGIWIMLLVLGMNVNPLFFVFAGIIGILSAIYLWQFSMLLTAVIIMVNLAIMWLFITKN